MSTRPLSRPRPLYATCDSGAESALAAELTKLRCAQIEPAHRGVYFWGSEVDLWRVNIYSRLANRILIPLSEFRASTREELYAECKKVRWDWWVHTSQTIAVDASSHESQLHHTHFISQVVKDAVVDQLRERFDERPSVDAKDPDLPINARIAHDTCTLSLDASGARLHRRGYRIEGGPAPLKETLAALLNHLIEWRPHEPLIDLTCGSGTLVIEAALRAQMIPPGWWRAERQTFAFQRWRAHSTHRFNTWWEDTSRPPPLTANLWGSDLDQRQISRARNNSRRAGVEDTIQWHVGDFNEQAEHAARWLDKIHSSGSGPSAPTNRRAVLLMNLPYGQRLNGTPDTKYGHASSLDDHSASELSEQEIQALEASTRGFFRDLGAQLKSHFKGCEAWLLVGERSPWREIGLKPQQQIALRNGPLKVKLVQIPIY